MKSEQRNIYHKVKYGLKSVRNRSNIMVSFTVRARNDGVQHLPWEGKIVIISNSEREIPILFYLTSSGFFSILNLESYYFNCDIFLMISIESVIMVTRYIYNF